MMTRKSFIKKMDKRMKQVKEEVVLARGVFCDNSVSDVEKARALKEYHFWEAMNRLYNNMQLEARMGRWQKRKFITLEEIWDYQEWYLNYQHKLFGDEPD